MYNSLIKIKKYCISILLLLSTILVLSACVSNQKAVSELEYENTSAKSESSNNNSTDISDRTQDTGSSIAASGSESVYQNNAAIADKNTPEFWISKLSDPDKIILNQADINRLNSQTLAYFNDGTWTSGFYDINQLGDQVSIGFICNHIQFNTLRNSQIFYKGAPITDAKWQEYEKTIGLKELEQKPAESLIPIKWAVTVDYTDVLDLPTRDIVTNSYMDDRENYLQQTLLAVNEPLAVLVDSADGQWSLVFANEYYGWVRKESYACFDNRNDYNAYFANNSLTIISDKTRASSNGYTLNLRLGTKLYLKDNTIETAMLPVRGENGKLKKLESVKISGDVVSGNLDLTKKNLIEIAFSLLGSTYEWGGSNKGRDCSSYMKDIYACFGIRIPRNTRDQERIPAATKLTEIVSYNVKKSVLMEAKPGDLFGIQGHVMMYLGEENGRLYVINMLGGYIPEDITNDFTAHIVEVRKCMVNSLDVHRGNGNTWTEEVLAMINLNKLK